MFLDGSWGAWAAYGPCSVTCGGGTQTHTRLCNNPSPANGGATCTGLASESGSCNTQLCAISIMLSVTVLSVAFTFANLRNTNWIWKNYMIF